MKLVQKKLGKRWTIIYFGRYCLPVHQFIKWHNNKKKGKLSNKLNAIPSTQFPAMKDEQPNSVFHLKLNKKATMADKPLWLQVCHLLCLLVSACVSRSPLHLWISKKYKGEISNTIATGTCTLHPQQELIFPTKTHKQTCRKWTHLLSRHALVKGIKM